MGTLRRFVATGIIAGLAVLASSCGSGDGGTGRAAQADPVTNRDDGRLLGLPGVDTPARGHPPACVVQARIAVLEEQRPARVVGQQHPHGGPRRARPVRRVGHRHVRALGLP